MTSAVLREDMKKGNVEMERRIYISLPKDSDHTVHKLGIVSRNIITLAKCRVCKLSDIMFATTNFKILKSTFLLSALILAWWYFTTT